VFNTEISTMADRVWVMNGGRVEQVGADGTPARVTAAEPMGRDVLYTADSSFGVIRFVEAGAEPRHREGGKVSLGFAPECALIFDKTSGRRLDVRIAA
jgi:TOBE domain